MGLKKAIDNLKFDARMLDINMKSQTLTAEDLKKQLEKLPDLSGACMPLEFEDEDQDSFGDEESN